MVNKPGGQDPLGTDPLGGKPKNVPNHGGDPLGRNPLVDKRDSIWQTPQSAPPAPMIMGAGAKSASPAPSTSQTTTFEEPPWIPFPEAVKKLDPTDENICQSMFPKAPEEEPHKIDEIFLLLEIRFGGEGYLIDLLLTQKIIRMTRITPTPRPNSTIMGAINLWGEIIPVTSFRSIFGFPKAAATKDTRIIIMTFSRGKIGIIADEVTEIARVPQSSLTHPHGKTRINPSYILGVCEAHGGYLPWVDIMKAVNEL
ncbi:hypothetical protein MNBD_NITROSPINAE01-167 [hydrothermal vent metagenome]|uniref:CheW-like domain-containing protein n=1 Tax=hydrothermal vent metagenome TaxID=652676 RepID=A0A3B1C4J7_9ZZZZ